MEKLGCTMERLENRKEIVGSMMEKRENMTERQENTMGT